MAEQMDFQSGTDVSRDNRSLKEIIEDIVHGFQSILQAEVRLARTEVAQKTQQLRQASLFLGIAALCGVLGAVCLVTTCIAALTLVMPLWLAALLIGIGLCLIAGGSFIMGRSRLEQVDPVPRQTVETLREDLQWAKHHIS